MVYKISFISLQVCIEDVITGCECVCRTEDGKILEGLTQDMLETVIPKTEPSFVMIVNGSHKGQVRVIINLINYVAVK